MASASPSSGGPSPSLPATPRLLKRGGGGGSAEGGSDQEKRGKPNNPGPFTGDGFWIDRPNIDMPKLLEPKDRLRRLVVVSSSIDTQWMTGEEGGFRSLPATLENPVLFFYDGPRRPIAPVVEVAGGGAAPAIQPAPAPAEYTAASVKDALDAASLAIQGGWTVIHHHNPKRRLHAKTLMARFGPGDAGEPAFVRVYVGSANFSEDRGRAFDVLWVQDFPIVANQVLPDIDDVNDPQDFRRTLRCFVDNVIDDAVPDEEEEQEQEAEEPMHQLIHNRLAELLRGADFSSAKGTLVASLPDDDDRLAGNGIHGLAAELQSFAWPDAASTSPINCLTGGLGNLNDPWLLNTFGNTAAHGAAPELRILWPTNAAGFLGDPVIAHSLVHSWRYNVVPFPHDLCWKAQAKPGTWNREDPDARAPLSHIKLFYRVAPADLSPATDPNEKRSWFLLGSHNLSKAAWGGGEKASKRPTNFELSVLLTPGTPQVAATWLDSLPLKLPPGPSRTGLELDVFDADRYRYPPYPHVAARSPWTFAYDSPQNIINARAAILAEIAAGYQD